jgi:hypothetical protein
MRKNASKPMRGIHFRAVDTQAHRPVVFPMRRTLSFACMAYLVCMDCFFSASVQAQTTPPPPPKATKTPTALPAAKAEPVGGQDYPHYVYPDTEDDQPSAADVGPAQRHFIRATETDNLDETQNADNASLVVHEKIALDKRISVPKIHDVLNTGPGSVAGNTALQYEADYLNWGAVTNQQLRSRFGHYFTITWDNDGPKADFTARFEYREVKSKEIVRTLTQNMPGVSGATRSYFAVVSKAFETYGPVVSWRFTILKGDTVVAEEKSYIW